MDNISLLVYRNYKLILTIITLMIVFIVLTGFSKKNTTANAATTNVKHYKCIEIQENDTLTSIANEYITSEYDSIEDYIEEVMHINKLYVDNDTIYCGATLVIPYYTAP